MEDSFIRYLTAKRTVDDRALNRTVWQQLVQSVRSLQKTQQQPLRVLELGAGAGTMVERLLTWELFDAQAVHYTLLDADPALLDAARTRLSTLPQWLQPSFVVADAVEYAEQENILPHDLLIANAVLDLLDLPTALPALRRLVRGGGLFYFTINFDGATLLEPAIDPVLDAAIENAYHRTMDERILAGHPSGDSRTGRHLFTQLPAAGFTIQAAGSSDWVVFPQDGTYVADEAYFLHFIVHTMQSALHQHAELPAHAFASWIAARHAQIDQGKLVYIAHQLDFYGIVTPRKP
ncbi:MAG: class I SAM-dependent methyltransferase [Caldilinea sp.]|jgi:SAM-dependent methyltransferase